MLLSLLLISQLLTANPTYIDKQLAGSKAETDYYAEGQKLLADGMWEKAIQTWIEGKEFLEGKNRTDPRLALSILETSVQHNATRYYKKATIAYYWMLQESNFDKWAEVLEQEVKRTIPIVADSLKTSWENKLAHNDHSVLTDLSSFWLSQDLLLSTEVNERLIEHWYRIVTAKDRYAKNNETVYSTDDRGLLYVKFGEPDYLESGPLFLEKTKIRELLSDLKTYRDYRSLSEIFNLQMSIQSAYSPTYVEFWIYDRFEGAPSIVYIFGKPADGSSFNLRKSVEDFIPSGAFSKNITVRGKYANSSTGYNAGSFIQMSLYNKLTTVHDFFGKMLSYYERNWNSFMRGRMNSSAFEQMTTSMRAEQQLWRIQQKAPQKNSQLEQKLSNINHTTKTFRFINKKNQSSLRFFVFPRPAKKLNLLKMVNGQWDNGEIFQVRNTIRAYSPENSEHIVKKNINLPNQKDFNNLYNNYSSSFEVELDSSYQYVYGTELYKIPKAAPTEHSTQKVNILAAKTSKLSIPVPLENNVENVQVSDIVLGFKQEQKNHYWGQIDFSIAPEGNIPSNQRLNFYFEVYHLTTSDTLEVNYQLQKREKREYKNTEVKIKLNLSVKNSTVQKQIEVNTSKLEEGDYRLLLTFSSLSEPERIITRSSPFTITKE